MKRDAHGTIKSARTATARAEARSDGEGEQSVRVGYGPSGELDANYLKSAQPPQPGGFGPDRALEVRLVEALRELELETYVPPVFNAFARMLADRLERKP